MKRQDQDLMRDIPRGVTSRYLREQRVPRGFFQDPDRILAREDLHYDPANSGRMLQKDLGWKSMLTRNNHQYVVCLITGTPHIVGEAS